MPANPVITTYLSDTSVPVDVRRNVANGLNSGDLSENSAVQGITAKYGNKYSSSAIAPAQSTPGNSPTPNSDGNPGDNSVALQAGGTIAKGIINALNPAKAIPAITQGAAKIGIAANNNGLLGDDIPTPDQQEENQNESRQGADQLAKQLQDKDQQEQQAQQKEKAFEDFKRGGALTILGNAANAAGQGVSQISQAGGSDEFGGAISGVDSQGNQLGADQRVIAAGKGAADVVSGTLKSLFAIPGSIVNAVPGGQQVTGAINDTLNKASGAAGNAFMNSMGIDPNSEQGKILAQHFQNLGQLFATKVSEDTASELGRQGDLADAQKAVEDAKASGDMSALEQATNNYEKLAGQKPSTITGNLGANTVQGATALAKPIVEGATTAGKAALDTTGAIAGKTIQTVGKGASDLGKSGLSLVSGLNRGTIDTALENPDALSAAQKVGIDASRQNTLSMLKNPIDQKISDLSDTGKAYDPIRNGGQTIDVPEDYLKNKLEEAGINVDKNGNLSATSKSSVRSNADINRLQDFYDMYNKPQLGADEFLNMRQDLANLAKYESGKTTQLQNFARDLRSSANEDLRPQIDGLEDLDNKYSSTTEDLKKVKNLIYDNKGNIKDNAVSSINNLLNKGKEGQLGRIQEALPDFDMNKFAQQIKVTKALEDIEIAKGNKIGTYARGGLTAGAGASLATGNIPAAAAIVTGQILTHPTILVPILKAFGKVSDVSSDFVSDVTSKIMDGIKPNDGEAEFVQNALKNVKPEQIQKFIKPLPQKQKTNV